MTTQDINRTSSIINPALARRSLLAAAVFTLCVGATAGGAWAQETGAALVTVQVIDRETGQPARIWRHAGKLYVAGQPGARYGLRVTNNSGGRVLAVMSVDGVNILTGETAAYGQRGYVFDAYQSYDINGWRKSDNEIAAFNFAPLAGSYAARTGRPNDVGVIGVAAFVERVAAPVMVGPPAAREAPGWSGTRRSPPPPRLQGRPAIAPPADVIPPPPLPIPPVSSRVETPAPPPPPPPSPSASAASGMARAEALAAPSADASAKLGTGHGAREYSHTVSVPFERASRYPQSIWRVEYDSPARLIAAGVIPRPAPIPPTPRPFPGERNGYVPDPPYRR